MRIVEGVYTSAKILTDAVEDYAIAQIKQLCDLEAFRDSKIRVMPDVHPGKVGTIGFTARVKGKILPNVVGVDIGCGITLAKLRQKRMEFQKLDRVIREQVPSGTQIRRKMTARGEAAFCGAERTPMRFRADAMRNITDAPKRSKKLLNFSAESLLCNASSPA